MEDEREKRDYLVRLVANLAQVREDWIKGDDNTLSPELALAVEETIEAFGHGLIPADCRALERRVHAMGVEYQRAKETAGGTWETGNLPGNGFWAALEHLMDAREALKPKMGNSIETIAELTAQKVTDAQICKIYGWVEGDGRPQLWKLREEREKPGKHTKHWVNPHERRRQELEAKQRESLAVLRDKQKGKLRRLTEPDPQPIDQLIQDGVSARQIAKMKRCSIEDVLAEADRLNLPRPMVDYEPLANQRSAHEHPVREEAVASMQAWRRRGREVEDAPDEDEDVVEALDQEGQEGVEPVGVEAHEETPVGAMTVEQEILLYHGQGHKPGDIATMMQAAGVSQQKVTAVIQRYARAGTR